MLPQRRCSFVTICVMAVVYLSICNVSAEQGETGSLADEFAVNNADAQTESQRVCREMDGCGISATSEYYLKEGLMAIYIY